MRRRALPPILLLVFVAGWILYLEKTTPAEPAASAAITVDECPGPAFPWGGNAECWGRSEGAAFAVWLGEHGSSAERFEENYPELASIFAEPWPPPPPYWRTCSTGRACAEAVIPRYFPTIASYALSIVSCETGGTFNARAVGDAGEMGLWQIHPIHFGWADPDRLFDPRYNTAAAYRLSEGGRDWSPWACA